MLKKIQDLLVQGIDGKALADDICAHFYETIEDVRKEHPVFYERLGAFDTVKDYLGMDPKELDYDEVLILDDLYADIEYLLQYRFDIVEDAVKKDILEGTMTSGVLKDMKSHGVFPISGKLTEDEVEEYYLEAFQNFDRIRQKIYDELTMMSPQAFYEKGQEVGESFKKKHKLLMDERDFVELFKECLDMEQLEKLMARRIYEAFHMHRRYQLEIIDLSDEPEDPDEESRDLRVSHAFPEDEYSENEEETLMKELSEGVLEPMGDLDPSDFPYVYDFMNEYTGKRILPSEDDRVTEAYWETYADAFGDLLGLYLIDALEETIHILDTERTIAYDSLARYYHWNQEDRKNPEVILSTCDKIGYMLTDIQQTLWSDFNERQLMPLWEEGRLIAEANKSEDDMDISEE